ncbi:MAG: polysaccharide pyruvyl transferase family protein, partial [Candidatus Margulisiibacteriota bacterium]
MKAIISGYYGFGNIGDEAVLKAIIDGFNKYQPSVQLTVLSSAPHFTKEINKVRAIPRDISFDLIKEIWETDVFISGGGSLFQDLTSKKSFYYYIGLVFLAKLFGKKTVVLGQGIGPLRSSMNRHICKWVLNYVDLI